jgi:fructokinase
MAQAICMGELLVDFVGERDASLAEAQQFLKAPGGAPANVAVGLARLGVATAFAGQVGDDPFGDWLRSTLADQGVDVSYLLQTPAARTTLAFVATRSDGRKDICFYRHPGADARFELEYLNPAMWNEARVFHVGSIALSESPCREAQFAASEMAQARGALISFDPNWRPAIWNDQRLAHALIWQMMALADIVKVADEEWEFVTGTSDLERGAATIREAGPRLVVVTRGEHGAYFDCAAARGEVPGFPVAAVDTLGAGDAFVAGLLAEVMARCEDRAALHGVLCGETLPEIIRFANACGALATQQPGAIPSLPTRAEVESFLRQS